MLLLLFTEQVGTVTPPTPTFECWRVTSRTVDAFVESHTLNNYWAYWSVFSWIQLYNAGYTWGNLSGQWFMPIPDGTLTWSQVIEGSCPAV